MAGKQCLICLATWGCKLVTYSSHGTLTWSHFDGNYFYLIAFVIHPVIETIRRLNSFLSCANCFPKKCRNCLIHIAVQYFLIVAIYQIINIFEVHGWDTHNIVLSYKEGSIIGALLLLVVRLVILECALAPKEEEAYEENGDNESRIITQKCCTKRCLAPLIVEIIFVVLFGLLTYHTLGTQSRHTV